jgi:hypothetical protein
MKVIATQRGYFGQLREPGDAFDVPEGSKASWFEPAKGEAKPETKSGGKGQQGKGAATTDDLV